MTIKELEEKGYKILPYASNAEAFLEFVNDSKQYASIKDSSLLHNGRRNQTTGLLPRELFCLTVLANVANFLSGDTWTPGALVDSSGRIPQGNLAHDGFILCTVGAKKNQFMWFEQVLATFKDKSATPANIESAIHAQARRKSSKGSAYGVDDMALIILVDYSGELSNLTALSEKIQTVAYKAVFLIGQISGTFRDCVCVILKSPADIRGPIQVRYERPDGTADVSRLYE